MVVTHSFSLYIVGINSDMINMFLIICNVFQNVTFTVNECS